MDRTFDDGYKLVSQTILDGGQESQIAESHIALAIIDEIVGLPTDMKLKRLYQMKDKKTALALNETMETNGEFSIVAADEHYIRTAGLFCPKPLKWNGSTRKIFAHFTSRHVSPDIGYWANELTGQLGQLLNGGRDSAKREFAQRVFGKFVSDYPGVYDDVVDKLISKNWSKQHRGEEVIEDDELRRNKRRTCRGEEPQTPTLVPKRKSPRKRKKPEPPSPDPRQNHPKSEYELLRQERVARNNERLKSLGLV